jgi:hypothetical protein
VLPPDLICQHIYKIYIRVDTAITCGYNSVKTIRKEIVLAVICFSNGWALAGPILLAPSIIGVLIGLLKFIEEQKSVNAVGGRQILQREIENEPERSDEQKE